MEKTRTKRFALIALLLSLALVACGFGILCSPLAAKADGEVEITFERALTASNWNAADQVTLMTDAGWNNDRDASNGTVSAVKVVSGSTTYNATHVYGYGNRLRFFFNGSGYNGQSPADGDRLEVSSDFTITLGGVAYKTSTGVIYTYNATTKTWTSNHVENLEGEALNVYVQQGLFSKYSVQTDSGYTDNDTSTLRTKALPYINLSSKSGFVGIPWT